MNITEKPCFEGEGTKIWQSPFDQKASPSCIGHWLVYAPWMHPLWDYHAVSLIHLRPLDGVEAAFQFPEATHEFLVLALDPNHEPTLGEELHFLRPVSITQQFVSVTDADALKIIEDGLQHVAAAKLSLDSDYRGVWKTLLRDG